MITRPRYPYDDDERWRNVWRGGAPYLDERHRVRRAVRFLRILAMRADGKTTEQIARKLKVSTTRIRQLEVQLCRRGGDPPLWQIKAEMNLAAALDRLGRPELEYLRDCAAAIHELFIKGK